MKVSVLIDETVKEFMTKYPRHVAVVMFRRAWQVFTFHQDNEARIALGVAIENLMSAANGTVMLVSDESKEPYHGLASSDDDDDNESENSYEGVTFH